MYSSRSTITLNMHEYEYSENKCTRVRLLYNILEYEYEYDYFNEYPVSNIKVTFMESLGVILVLLLCH